MPALLLSAPKLVLCWGVTELCPGASCLMLAGVKLRLGCCCDHLVAGAVCTIVQLGLHAAAWSLILLPCSAAVSALRSSLVWCLCCAASPFCCFRPIPLCHCSVCWHAVLTSVLPQPIPSMHACSPALPPPTEQAACWLLPSPRPRRAPPLPTLPRGNASGGAAGLLATPSTGLGDS